MLYSISSIYRFRQYLLFVVPCSFMFMNNSLFCWAQYRKLELLIQHVTDIRWLITSDQTELGNKSGTADEHISELCVELEALYFSSKLF
jgi:hypothetical protein